MTTKKDDQGQAEAQKAADDAAAKGFIGHSPAPHKDEEFSQQTGPTSPTPAETRRAVRRADADR